LKVREKFRGKCLTFLPGTFVSGELDGRFGAGGVAEVFFEKGGDDVDGDDEANLGAGDHGVDAQETAVAIYQRPTGVART
jgi:hypothetical protein